MAFFYMTMVNSITAHWKAHNNAYPQKIVLSPAQFKEFSESRRQGKDADYKVDDTNFMGVRIEQAEGSPGVVIAVDGTEVSLAPSE